MERLIKKHQKINKALFDKRFKNVKPPSFTHAFYDASYKFVPTSVRSVRFVKLKHQTYDPLFDASPMIEFYSRADMSVVDPRFAKEITYEDVVDGLFHIRDSFGDRNSEIASRLELADWYSKGLEKVYDRGVITNIHVCNEAILSDIPDGALVEAQMTFFAVFARGDRLLCWEEELFNGMWCPVVHIKGVQILKENALKRPGIIQIVKGFLGL